MRTQEEIDAEIEALKAAKAVAPRYSKFDDDNHAAIDRQIEVLSGDMDEEDVEEQFGGEDDEPALRDAALEAIDWREGETDEAPSAGWDIYKPKG